MTVWFIVVTLQPAPKESPYSLYACEVNTKQNMAGVSMDTRQGLMKGETCKKNGTRFVIAQPTMTGINVSDRDDNN
jgi:hypothetical protein